MQPQRNTSQKRRSSRSVAISCTPCQTESYRLHCSSTRLLPSGFTSSLTLSSKFFATFPHGTCSLSVSWSVFSLGWSLPPALGCDLKQPDSRGQIQDTSAIATGLTPAMGRAPFKRTSSTQRHYQQRLSLTPQFLDRNCGFGAGLFPVHSPLLRESLLVSFPPLSNMLKFSG